MQNIEHGLAFKKAERTRRCARYRFATPLIRRAVRNAVQGPSADAERLAHDVRFLRQRDLAGCLD
jgi:hypothetical protein